MQAASQIIPGSAVLGDLHAARLGPSAHRIAEEGEVHAVGIVRVVVNAAADIVIVIIAKDRTEVQNGIASKGTKGNTGGHITLDKILKGGSSARSEGAAPAGAVGSLIHELAGSGQESHEAGACDLRGRGIDADEALAAAAHDGQVGAVTVELHDAVAVLRILLAIGIEVKDGGMACSDGDRRGVKVAAIAVAEDQRKGLGHFIVTLRCDGSRQAAARDLQPFRAIGDLKRQPKVGEGVAAVGIIFGKGTDIQTQHHDDSQKY